MFSSLSLNTEKSGNRKVRRPVRVSQQSKYYSKNIGIYQPPNKRTSHHTIKCQNTGKESIPQMGGSNVRFMDLGDDLGEDVATITDEPGPILKEHKPPNIDMVASNVLLSITGENDLYKEKLEKYGKICAETGKLCLGCEQDPIDMQWYSQESWDRWTNNELSCPQGIIEYHELTLNNSFPDSWDPEVIDTVVFGEQIYNIDCCSIGSRARDIHIATIESNKSRDNMKYVPGEYIQYAIINEAYPNHESGGYYIDPIYLVTYNGIMYPILGSEDPGSTEYNPIIFEVVKNLKYTLTGNIYDCDYD